ncbi:hypothetical protein V5799_004141 [Amblyomma americanum]|uniref:Uncharacterized protein n=1 Tax=Amblyomma americanum TaxID=6943 RepID=A0AAQ4D6Y7_AMBAM
MQFIQEHEVCKQSLVKIGKVSSGGKKKIKLSIGWLTASAVWDFFKIPHSELNKYLLMNFFPVSLQVY